MKAEKAYDLLSVSQRPRKAGGVIQPETEGLRTSGAEGKRKPGSQLK